MTSDSQDKEKKQSLCLRAKLKVQKLIKLFVLITPILKPYLSVMITSYAITLLQTCLTWYSPIYTGGIIDIVTRSKDPSHLWDLLRDMMIFNIINSQVGRFGSKANRGSREAFNHNLKAEIYKKLLDRRMEFFDDISSEEALNILSHGIENLSNLCLDNTKSVLQTIFGTLTSFYSMYMISPELAKIIMITAPIKFILETFNSRNDTKINERRNKLYTLFWRLPWEALDNMLLVKCFSTEDKEHKKYVEVQRQIKEVNAEYNGEPWYLALARTLVNEIFTLFLIYRGGQMVLNGQMTAGDLSMFNMYAKTFSDTAVSIHTDFKDLYKNYQQSLEILKLLEISAKAQSQPAQNLTKPNLIGTIAINNVSFCYPSKPEVEVLTDINLKINAGESIAFVGVSGSGKTTLSYLLQNLYTPTQGRIFIDGEDVKDYDVPWLHHHMGYVSQEPVLLNRTIEENIVYGIKEEYTPEQVDKALTMSNSRFILNKEKFPDGLQTDLNKTTISGGQKQRIAIARAFIKDPKILILDEPTSALDGESESKVQKAIDDLIALGDRTVIVIAHRLSTIINCHKIVVFDEGRIVEQGTHRELMNKDGAYKKLFEFQINNMKNL